MERDCLGRTGDSSMKSIREKKSQLVRKKVGLKIGLLETFSLSNRASIATVRLEALELRLLALRHMLITNLY